MSATITLTAAASSTPFNTAVSRPKMATHQHKPAQTLDSVPEYVGGEVSSIGSSGVSLGVEGKLSVDEVIVVFGASGVIGTRTAFDASLFCASISPVADGGGAGGSGLD